MAPMSVNFRVIKNKSLFAFTNFSNQRTYNFDKVITMNDKSFSLNSVVSWNGTKLQWNWINNPKANLEDFVDLLSLFLCFFRVLDVVTYSEDILQTLDWAKNAQNMASHLILSLGIYDMSPSQGHVHDMSGTFPTMAQGMQPLVHCFMLINAIKHKTHPSLLVI